MATNALTFNGINHYGTIANFAAIDALTGNFTIEGWFYNSATSPAYAVAHAITTASGSPLETLNTENGTGNEGTNFGVIYSGTNADGYKSTGVFTRVTWVHVAMVSTLNNKTKIYLNGTELSSYDLQQTPTGTINSPTGLDFTIGQETSWPSGPFWKGAIGGFIRVWSDIRTQTELNNNKALNLLASGEDNLIINLKFGEGAGTTLYNEATAGADMTLYNTPTWSTGPTITEKSYGGTTYHKIALLGVG